MHILSYFLHIFRAYLNDIFRHIFDSVMMPVQGPHLGPLALAGLGCHGQNNIEWSRFEVIFNHILDFIYIIIFI